MRWRWRTQEGTVRGDLQPASTVKPARGRDVRHIRPVADEDFMFVILSFLMSLALVTLAYAQSRNFVMRRLRYVDAVQHALAPFIAGIGAAAVTWPIFALLPLVGLGTALSVGFAVGADVAASARAAPHSVPRY